MYNALISIPQVWNRLKYNTLKDQARDEINLLVTQTADAERAL